MNAAKNLSIFVVFATALTWTTYPQVEQTLPTVDAAVCAIDVTNKTVDVMPWDGKTWKRKPLTVLSWDSDTELVKFWDTKHVTMAKFVGGVPLDETIKSVSDLKGERVTFHVQKVGERQVARKMEIEIGAFAHEPISAMGGNNRVQIVGGPEKIQCDEK